MIWTPGVRGLDITDGHIDGSVRIVRPGVLMMAFNPEDTTENADAQLEAKRVLSRARDARGRTFEIVERSKTRFRPDHGAPISSPPTPITMSATARSTRPNLEMPAPMGARALPSSDSFPVVVSSRLTLTASMRTVAAFTA
ncbi:MAG: agmatine deiminase family protein [Caulobacteraceae bacterium]|nr:agmatine deiminase family protein [Caulobacteraceae bacterium]